MHILREHFVKRLAQGFILFSLLAAGFLFVPSAALAQASQPAPVNSSANIADNICRGILSAQTGSFGGPDTTVEACKEQGDESFGFIVRRVINIFSLVVGAVSVIMIIIGGFRYIISGGDSSGVTGAKNTILYAIVGLIIVLFAQVIIRFVLSNAVPGN